MSRTGWTQERIGERYRVRQQRDGYRFNMDSVLLSSFVSLRPGMKVLDIGTGVGVIPFLLLERQPSLEILGVEIQESLCALARQNARQNRVAEIRILQGDARLLDASYHNRFDLVLSNPPYHRTGEGISPRSEEAQLARQEQTLSLAELFGKAYRLVRPRGRFGCIYPSRRLEEALREGRDRGFSPLRLRFVHSRAGKPARAFLLEMGKDAGNQLIVERPLILHGQTGPSPGDTGRTWEGGDPDGGG